MGAGRISGPPLGPGLYRWSTGVTLASDLALAGGPNDVWIFQVGGDLTLNADKHIALSGGARAKTSGRPRCTGCVHRATAWQLARD